VASRESIADAFTWGTLVPAIGGNMEVAGGRGQSGDPGVRGTDQKSAGTLVDFPGQVLASRARIVAVTARDARPRCLIDTW
jgi:hypothetical protein